MKKKRHQTEEIIRIIRKADGGQTVEEVCREESLKKSGKSLCEETIDVLGYSDRSDHKSKSLLEFLRWLNNP